MIFTQKEPKIARFTEDHAIIKDHHYYKGKEITWNRPAHITEKFYDYYLKGQNDNQEAIKKMKEQETLEKKELEEYRKQYLIYKREEDKARLTKRTKERSLLESRNSQTLASSNLLTYSQNTETGDIQEFVAKKMNASKHTRAKDNLRNFLHKADKKFVECAIRPICLKGEEETVAAVAKRMEKEKEKVLQEQVKQHNFHEKVRKSFLKRHEENFQFEKSVGLVPNASRVQSKAEIKEKDIPIISVKDASESRIEFNTLETPRSLNSIQPSEAQSKFSTKFLAPPSSQMDKRVRTASLDRMSMPKQRKIPEFNYQLSEFNGMLVRNMDENIFQEGNYFYEKLKHDSKVFNDVLEQRKSSRKVSATTMRPQTSSSKQSIKVTRESFNSTPNNHIPIIVTRSRVASLATTDTITNRSERESVFDDIHSFEKQMIPGQSRIGYPNIHLEEAKRLSSARGLSVSTDLAAKKKLPLIK